MLCKGKDEMNAELLKAIVVIIHSISGAELYYYKPQLKSVESRRSVINK